MYILNIMKSAFKRKYNCDLNYTDSPSIGLNGNYYGSSTPGDK